jgi:hypothetical protein
MDKPIKKVLKMKTVSIGYFRDDGDFALLATLNNNDGDIRFFEFMVKDLQRDISQSTGIECVVLEREDAPDYVTID